MRISYYLLFIIACTPFYSFSQNYTNRFQLSLANDNDVYLLQKSDRYYTNGISLDFLMSLKRDVNNSTILQFNLEHQLFNGVRVFDKGILYWDRPFAAVFSLKSSLNRYINNNRVLKFSVDLEQNGPRAQGEKIQSFIHTAFNMYKVVGWENQTPNSFGVDLGIQYDENLFTGGNRNIGISSSLEAVVGMNNVYFTAGIPFRLGKFKDFTTSVFTKGHLNSDELNDEFFFFYKPSLTYQVKNSSIADIDNLNNQVPDNEMQSFIFTQQVGGTLSKGKATLSLSIVRYNTELAKMKYNHHQYGRIEFGYKF